tara:strand:- start:401 stop:535 length:135 start_codon:yes stop_codon:yes gene_type:complete
MRTWLGVRLRLRLRLRFWVGVWVRVRRSMWTASSTLLLRLAVLR